MTTAVYVLISSDKDLYYEQALLSAYSLRLHNPDMDVVVLTDNPTASSLTGKRSLLRELVTEIKVIDVPEEYTPKERSRFIKTTFRKYIPGNLLFIDTDTIITGSLADVENTDAEIACVLDYHQHLDEQIYRRAILNRIRRIFYQEITDERNYYNSGVIFVRETTAVSHLFELWHKYWEYSTFSRCQCYDQPALLMADRDCGHIIKELNGIYNCQILTSITFLHEARIIHFFNNYYEGKSEMSPFFQDCIYIQIKQDGCISDSTKILVADCKNSFLSPHYFFCSEQVRFMNSLLGRSVYAFYKAKNISYHIINLYCRLRISVIHSISHLKKCFTVQASSIVSHLPICHLSKSKVK